MVRLLKSLIKSSGLFYIGGMLLSIRNVSIVFIWAGSLS